MTYRGWQPYAVLPALIISLLVFIAALIIWIIPVARIWFTFNLDPVSWSILTLAVAALLCIIYYLITHVVQNQKLRNTLAMLVALLVLYFSGAFLLARLGVVPQADTWFAWLHGDASTLVSTLTFFLAYTSLILISVYLVRNNSYLALVVNTLRKAGTRLLRLTYLDCIWAFVYIASAIFLGSVGIGPDISMWPSHLLQTFVFFVLYTLALIVAWRVYELLIYLFRGPLTTEWFIWMAIYGTIILQIACFFTSYFGFRIILPEFLPDRDAFSLSLPPQISSIFNLHDNIMSWTQNELISIGASLVFSGFILIFATWALLPI